MDATGWAVEPIAGWQAAPTWQREWPRRIARMLWLPPQAVALIAVTPTASADPADRGGPTALTLGVDPSGGAGSHGSHAGAALRAYCQRLPLAMVSQILAAPLLDDSLSPPTVPPPMPPLTPSAPLAPRTPLVSVAVVVAVCVAAVLSLWLLVRVFPRRARRPKGSKGSARCTAERMPAKASRDGRHSSGDGGKRQRVSTEADFEKTRSLSRVTSKPAVVLLPPLTSVPPMPPKPPKPVACQSRVSPESRLPERLPQRHSRGLSVDLRLLRHLSLVGEREEEEGPGTPGTSSLPSTPSSTSTRSSLASHAVLHAASPTWPCASTCSTCTPPATRTVPPPAAFLPGSAAAIGPPSSGGAAAGAFGRSAVCEALPALTRALRAPPRVAPSRPRTREF